MYDLCIWINVCSNYRIVNNVFVCDRTAKKKKNKEKSKENPF